MNPLAFIDPYGLSGMDSNRSGTTWEFHPENVGIALNNAVDGFYGAVETGGNAFNDFLQTTIGEPGWALADKTTDWLNDRSDAEKFGIAFAPIGGGLLFTEAAVGVYIGAGNAALQNAPQINQAVGTIVTDLFDQSSPSVSSGVYENFFSGGSRPGIWNQEGK